MDNMTNGALATADTTVATTTIKMKFITVAAFKGITGATVLELIESPKTNKWFTTTPIGNYKVEKGLDTSKEVRFMYNDTEGFEKGCLVNVVESANVRGTL